MQKDQRNGENGVDEDRRGRAGRRMLNNSALLWTVTRQYGELTTTLVCKAAGLCCTKSPQHAMSVFHWYYAPC